MHTDQASKEKPTGSANYPAGNTDIETVTNLADTIKAFAILRARFELRGQTLSRTSPAVARISFLSQRWGFVRHLPTVGEIHRFLARIGGQHE